MADAKQKLARFTSWLGLACGVLSLVVFFFLMPAVSPRVVVYDESFTKDYNRYTWSFDWMCRTYGHFFVWNFVMALFGQIGYSGIIGIIASAFTLLCTLLSLICAFLVKDQSAKLQITQQK